MHKKVVLVFFLFALVLSPISFSQESVNIINQTTPTGTSNVRIVGLDLQIERPDNSSYYSVNTSSSAAINNVYNSTSAIFISSFVNENDQDILLNSFIVNEFNASVTTVPEHTITKTYATSSPANITIPANSTYTEIYNGTIYFAKLKQLYSIQYQYKYAFASNLSNVLTVSSVYNFTINAANLPYSPPTFIIWLWWAVTGLIAIQLFIGWYGNRKNKNRNQN